MLPTIPYERTARRLEWRALPPRVRERIETRCGSPVIEASTRSSGFTAGFASVLRCADGSDHFVKAASTVAQSFIAEAYRDEARKLALLPVEVPAPRLRWVMDADEWVVLGIEHVDALIPGRPWSRADLDATLGMLDTVARVLTPAPGAMGLTPFADEVAPWLQVWDARDVPPVSSLRSVGLTAGQVDELAGLASRYREALVGDTVVHNDVREDNVLLCRDGRVLLCDWNSTAVGPPWVDSCCALIGPRGDGLDVDDVIDSHPRLRATPPEHVDIFLALVLGYFLDRASLPLVPSSPHLRDVQRWQGEVVLGWLAERRGWALDTP